MNKKLTTILLAVLIILIGKVDAATLTQKVGAGFIESTVDEGQEVTVRFVSTKYTFSSWTVESGDISIDTTNPVVTFTMPSSNVVIKANYVGQTQYYTISYNANGGSGTMTTQTVEAGQTVALNTNSFTRDGYNFKGWAISSSVTTATYTDGQSITPTASMTLYAIWEEVIVLSDVATVGAYVSYTPSSTSYTVPTTVSGYTSDQNFNPSSTTSWRVFSNDGTNVEIISADSVGNLSLSGDTGYINAVQTLQDMSAAYVNSEYATSGRSLGYYDEKVVDSFGNLGDDMTETQKANYRIINTDVYSVEYGVSGLPYSDYQYKVDQTVLSNNTSMYHSSGEVWLASRCKGLGGYGIDGTNFCIVSVDSSGNFRSDYLCGWTAAGSGRSTSYTRGVRPVITLKAGFAIIDGSGTSDDPYILTDTTTSKYTVTYCANGGYGDMNPQSVAQGSSVTLTTNAYEHHSKTFAGWATSATATSATYTDGESVTPTADITLYAVWEEQKTPLSDVATIGAYVTYVPSSTSYTVSTSASGYTSDQTYNPSSTTSWRVFSNDGTNIEIISADSVGNLALRGETGYVNAVQTLQDMSAAYVNSEYATSGRSLGYSEDGLTEEEIENYKVINTTGYPLYYGANVAVDPYNDLQYLADRTVINNNSILYHSSGYVWFASRFAELKTSASFSYFGVNFMDTSGEGNDVYHLYGLISDGTVNTYTRSYGVRPVVSLKAGIKITGGSGTSTDPYTISQ